MSMLQVYCRASVARKEHQCIACNGIIKIGELFMRFIPRTMGNEILHIECYAHDCKERFAVAVDYRPFRWANFVVVDPETLEDSIKQIWEYKNNQPSTESQ